MKHPVKLWPSSSVFAYYLNYILNYILKMYGIEVRCFFKGGIDSRKS